MKSVASKGGAAIDRSTEVIQGSLLYRWLTAEPEPDVVVIDLRETYTVGPFIRLIDAGIDWLTPYWKSSRLKRVVAAVFDGLNRLSETRVGRTLTSILAPPEPPDDAGASELPTRETKNRVEDD